MSYPARGPASAGVDGKAIAASGRLAARMKQRNSEEAAQ